MYILSSIYAFNVTAPSTRPTTLSGSTRGFIGPPMLSWRPLKSCCRPNNTLNTRQHSATAEKIWLCTCRIQNRRLQIIYYKIFKLSNYLLNYNYLINCANLILISGYTRQGIWSFLNNKRDLVDTRYGVVYCISFADGCRCIYGK